MLPITRRRPAPCPSPPGHRDEARARTTVHGRHAAAACSLLAAWIFAAAPAAAWIVSGQVTDAFGQGVADVDLDFEDQATGLIVTTPGDRTGLDGHYAATVPPGDYRIFFTPAPGARYFADRIDQVIGSDTTIDLALAGGVYVSGRVVDGDGFGLGFVDLNFYDSADGSNLGYAGDNTDAFGDYSVLVEPGRTVDILYRPSPGDPHCALEVGNVAIGTSDRVLPDVVLEAGQFVSGTVRRRDTAAAVADADVDAVNAVTGEKRSRLGFDDSDASGAFQVVLPTGTWDILVSPPAGQGLAAAIRPGLAVSASTSIGVIELPVGLSVAGTVLGPGNAPQLNANVDPVLVSLGVEVPTGGDHTTASGQYSMTLGADTYDVLVWPPPGSPLAAGVLRNRVISASTTLPTVVLSSGLAVSGTVRTTTGLPVTGVDINAEQLSDGFVYPTPEDNTDHNGGFAIRVPAGSYRFIARPPAGSGLVPDTVLVNLSTGRTLDFTLGATSASGVGDRPKPGGLSLSGGRLAPGGAPLSLRFTLPGEEPRPVTLRAWSVDGRLRRTLLEGVRPGGVHELAWDGRDDSGRRLPGGVYYLRLSSGDGSATARVVVAE